MYQMTKKNILILSAAIFSWSGLGAYRGVQDYNKEYRKDYRRYLKDTKYNREPKYYYLSCFGRACIFAIMYPWVFPLFFIDELYNVEKFIRNIKDDDE
jgi:hypothetical protein